MKPRCNWPPSRVRPSRPFERTTLTSYRGSFDPESSSIRRNSGSVSTRHRAHSRTHSRDGDHTRTRTAARAMRRSWHRALTHIPGACCCAAMPDSLTELSQKQLMDAGFPEVSSAIALSLSASRAAPRPLSISLRSLSHRARLSHPSFAPLRVHVFSSCSSTMLLWATSRWAWIWPTARRQPRCCTWLHGEIHSEGEGSEQGCTERHRSVASSRALTDVSVGCSCCSAPTAPRIFPA